MPQEFQRESPMPTTMPGTGLDKAARIRRIYEVLAAYPNAKSAEGAHRLITLAFEEVEHNKDINTKGGAMVVSPFQFFDSTVLNGRKIYFKNHGKNLLLLGDNGAINILRTSLNPDNSFSNDGVNLAEAKAKLSSEFSKPGADGKDVWGN